MTAPLLLVGNPGTRRTTLFAAALARAGRPGPRLVSWRTVLADGPSRAGRNLASAMGDVPPLVVRIDSPGDDPHVDRLLRGAPAPAPQGAITAGPGWFTGFVAATGTLAAATAAARAASSTDPADLAVLFDKTACHARLAAAGVPVPAALDAPGTPPIAGWAELRERLAARGWRRVFLKPAHGSSASGVLALQSRNRGANLEVIARGPIELDDNGRLWNNLRPRVFRGEPAVSAVVDRLAARRLHVERWFPKLVLGGRALDVRVLVVDGTATHAVVRTAAGSITNLHLGNARGDLAALRTVLGEAGWRRVLEVAEAAARCFPGMLTVGVDVLIGVRRDPAGLFPVAVAEVNAFGDLLPNLAGLARADHDPYDAQIAALIRRKLL